MTEFGVGDKVRLKYWKKDDHFKPSETAIVTLTSFKTKSDQGTGWTWDDGKGSDGWDWDSAFELVEKAGFYLITDRDGDVAGFNFKSEAAAIEWMNENIDEDDSFAPYTLHKQTKVREFKLKSVKQVWE